MDALTSIPGYGMVVGIRPLSSDIVPSIKENRNVRLQYQGLHNILKEKFGATQVLVTVSVGIVMFAIIVMAISKYFVK